MKRGIMKFDDEIIDYINILAVKYFIDENLIIKVNAKKI